MSQPHNPYAKNALETVNTGNDNNVLMQDSPSSKNSGFDESKQESNKDIDDKNQLQKRHNANEEEEIDFEENPFQIPPSFNQSIMEETLHNDDQLYVFWASLHLPIPKDLANSMAAVYDALEEFVTQFAEEDPHFIIFLTVWVIMSKSKIFLHLLRQQTISQTILTNDIDKWLD